MFSVWMVLLRGAVVARLWLRKTLTGTFLLVLLGADSAKLTIRFSTHILRPFVLVETVMG